MRRHEIQVSVSYVCGVYVQTLQYSVSQSNIKVNGQLVSGTSLDVGSSALSNDWGNHIKLT